jgi:Spy/CpxP family protein refolding chaperone
MTNPSNSPKRKSGNLAATALVALGLSVAITAQAFTASDTYAHMKLFASSGSDDGESHGHFGRHGRMSPEKMAQHAERVVKHLAIEIDATAEQQQKLTVLAKALISEIAPMRGTMHQTGDEIRALLMAPVIDRAALEKIRADKIAQADELSKTVTNAVADAAEVLTPEQRKTVAERIETFRKFRGRWHR